MASPRWATLLTHVSAAQAQDAAVAAAQHAADDVSQDSRTHFGLREGGQRESERLVIHAKNGHRIKGVGRRGGGGAEAEEEWIQPPLGPDTVSRSRPSLMGLMRCVFAEAFQPRSVFRSSDCVTIPPWRRRVSGWRSCASDMQAAREHRGKK